MKIKELIKLLQLYPEDTEVMAFDASVSWTAPVTGALYDSGDETLELTTDD
jgi:hypothetical protein